jgi:hypothetical protein
MSAYISKIADNMNGRYFADSQTQGVTTTYRPNYGVPFSSIGLKLFTGVWPNLTPVANPAASGWTIAANPTNPTQEIDVTTPGTPATYDYVLVTTGTTGGKESIDDFPEIDISTNPPSTNEVLVYNGSQFVPGTVGGESQEYIVKYLTFNLNVPSGTLSDFTISGLTIGKHYLYTLQLNIGTVSTSGFDSDLTFDITHNSSVLSSMRYQPPGNNATYGSNYGVQTYTSTIPFLAAASTITVVASGTASGTRIFGLGSDACFSSVVLIGSGVTPGGLS